MTREHQGEPKYGYADDGRRLDSYADATRECAGPFCVCGDPSCDGNGEPGDNSHWVATSTRRSQKSEYQEPPF